ncbi:hypothetical protein LK08_17710 [Streptomyces sp. MUSC 125]|nr:hypothetical protein LK08_17710 [Streptomyces sp. MUSC 125]
MDRLVGEGLCDPVVEGFHANIVDTVSGYAAKALDLLTQGGINTYGEDHDLAFLFRCWHLRLCVWLLFAHL